MEILWTLRSLLGGLSLVAIVFVLATLPQPGLSGAIALAFAIAMIPSLLALGAIVGGQKARDVVVPWIGLLALPWSLFAFPAGLVIGYSNQPFLALIAIPIQCVALPLLVSTRDRGRMILLGRIVRGALLFGMVAWLVSSMLFAGWVRLEANRTANGQSYCLSFPALDGTGTSLSLPPHLDFLLMQRLIAFPTASRIDLHRVATDDWEAAHIGQYSLSLGVPRFVEGLNLPLPEDCDAVLRD